MIRLKKTDDRYEVTVSVTKTIPKNMAEEQEVDIGPGTVTEITEGGDVELPPDTSGVASEIASQLITLAKNAPDFDEVKMDKTGKMTCVDLTEVPGEDEKDG